MKDAGERLNLQPHIVRCVDGAEREVYAAADIEVFFLESFFCSLVIELNFFFLGSPRKRWTCLSPRF